MRLALLTNFVPPYRRLLYAAMTRLFPTLKIFISTQMESNRNWEVNHLDLQVVEQKSISINRRWKHKAGFEENLPIHFPIDTFSQLNKTKPDVVISVELGFRSLVAMSYCKAKKKPLILWVALSEHTETSRGFLRFYLRKMLLREAAAVFCNGKSSERYIRSMGFTKKSYFIPYTSDYSINTKINSPDKVRKVLFSGQLNSRKGIREMVFAITELLKQKPQLNFQLTVVGDGAEKHYLDQLKQLPQVQLSLIGTVKYEELKELYKKADLFLFPTLADEWGIVVNEALSSGLAIIGSKYSQAVEELVVEGKNGWIFDPLNAESFGKKLELALSIDDKELMKMKQNATESIVDFNHEKVAKDIQKAVEETVSEGV